MMPEERSEFLHQLDAEIGRELSLAESSGSSTGLGASTAEWLYDPTDDEREQVGLRNIQGAVEALEDEAPTL